MKYYFVKLVDQLIASGMNEKEALILIANTIEENIEDIEMLSNMINSEETSIVH